LLSETCPVSGWSDCAPFDCQTTITHLNTIAGGNLEYLVYQYNDDLTNRIQRGNLDAQYSGRTTITATVLIAFKGTPIGELLDSEQQRFVETITSSFIAEGLVGLTNVNVVGSKIIYQNGPGVSSSRRLQEISSQADNWIELTVDVLATLTPPYKGNVEFDELVLSSFRNSREDYIYDLKNYRFRPGSLVEGKRGDYFMNITQVSARKSEDGQAPGRGSVLPKGSTGFGTINSIIFSSICVALLVLGIVWVVKRRKRVNAKDNSEGIFVTGKARRRSLISPAFGFEEAMGRLASKTKDKPLKHGRKENSSEYRFTDAEAQDSNKGSKMISNKSRSTNQQSRVPQTRKARQETKLESSKQQSIEKSHSHENSLEGSTHSGGRTKVRTSGSTERQLKNEIEVALQLSLQDEKAKKTQASPSSVKERSRGRDDQSSKARDIMEQLGKSLDRSKSTERPETSSKSESDLEIALRLSLQDEPAQMPLSNVQGKYSPRGISKQSGSNADPTHPRAMAQLSENIDNSGISLEASPRREKAKSSAVESDLELALRLSLQDEKERKDEAATSHLSEEIRRSRRNEGVTAEKSTLTQMRSSDRSIENIDKSTSSDDRSRIFERVTAESKRSKPESDLEIALRLSLQDEKVRQSQGMSSQSPNDNQKIQGANASFGDRSEPSRQHLHGQSSGNSDQLDNLSSPRGSHISRSNLKVRTSSPSDEIVCETDLEMALRLSLQQETERRSQETTVPISSDHVGGESTQSSRPLISGETNSSARIHESKHSSRATRSTASRSAVQDDDIAAAIALSLQEENARKNQMTQSKSQSMIFSRDKTGVGTDSHIQESKSMRTTRSQAFPVIPKTSESSIRVSRTTTSSLTTSTQPQSSLLSSEPSSSKLQTSKSILGSRSSKLPAMAKSTSVRFSDTVKGPGSQELQSSQSLRLDSSTTTTERSSSEQTVADQEKTSAQPTIRGSASMRGPRSSLQQTQSVRFSRSTGINKDERIQGSKSMRGPRTNP
jgi:Ubiquitin interaction motif